MVQLQLDRDPHGGDLLVFRGRIGSLVKIIWHDGLGGGGKVPTMASIGERRRGDVALSKRLEKGRFVWPSAKEGVVSLTTLQLACLLKDTDCRNPQHSWRPTSAA